ncbi:MAG: hypothetical protein ACTSRG_21755 [Candidatus Helarchaeota archaeon]
MNFIHKKKFIKKAKYYIIALASIDLLFLFSLSIIISSFSYLILVIFAPILIGLHLCSLKILIDIWKSAFFTQFSGWKFIYYSNYFYDFNFKDNSQPVWFGTKLIHIPNYFSNFIDLKDFNISFVMKNWKIRGLSRKKPISFKMRCYMCNNINNNSYYFSVLIFTIEKISFQYIAFPPHIQNEDLLKLKIRLPIYYSSKIPIPKEIIRSFFEYSDTIMHFTERINPLVFDHNKLFSLKDLNDAEIEIIEEKLRDFYKIPNVKNNNAFKDYEEIFSSPIIEKRKVLFNDSWKPLTISGFDEVFSISLRGRNSAKSFMVKLVSDRFIRYYLAQQDIYLMKFLFFLDWVKENMAIFDNKERKEFRNNIGKLEETFLINYLVEFNLNNGLQISNGTIFSGQADNSSPNIVKMHLSYLDTFLKRYKRLLSEFDYFIRDLTKFQLRMEQQRKSKDWKRDQLFKIFPFLNEKSDLFELQKEIEQIPERCYPPPSREQCENCKTHPKNICWPLIISDILNLFLHIHTPVEVADGIYYIRDKAVYFIIKAQKITKQTGEGDRLFRQCFEAFQTQDSIVYYINPLQTESFVIERIRRSSEKMSTNPYFEELDKKYLRQIYLFYKSKNSEN